MFDLDGFKAVVTGGREGLGRAVVEAFARAGCKCVVIDVAADTSEAVRAMGSAYADVHGVCADLLDREKLNASFQEAMKLLGGQVDVLVTAAGLRYAVPALEHDLERWDRTLELNVSAVFRMCQLAGKIMIDRGRGSIINFASIRSFVGSLDAAAYGVTKGAIASLTRSLSNEWASKGVRVNAIAPGYMKTALSAPVAAKPDESAEIMKRVPIGRWGVPEDLAGLSLLLASDASSYITGTIIPCDGGFLAR